MTVKALRGSSTAVTKPSYGDLLRDRGFNPAGEQPARECNASRCVIGVGVWWCELPRDHAGPHRCGGHEWP